MAFRKAESYLLAVLLVIAGVFVYTSSITKTTIAEPVSARDYGLVISSLFLLTVITRFLAINTKAYKEKDKSSSFKIDHPRIILISTIAMIAYTLGIIWIGYYVMTFLYTFGMMLLLREGRTAKVWILTAVGCLVFVAALYWIFSMFNVYLPNAWLI